MWLVSDCGLVMNKLAGLKIVVTSWMFLGWTFCSVDKADVWQRVDCVNLLCFLEADFKKKPLLTAPQTNSAGRNFREHLPVCWVSKRVWLVIGHLWLIQWPRENGNSAGWVQSCCGLFFFLTLNSRSFSSVASSAPHPQPSKQAVRD